MLTAVSFTFVSIARLVLRNFGRAEGATRSGCTFAKESSRLIAVKICTNAPRSRESPGSAAGFASAAGQRVIRKQRGGFDVGGGEHDRSRVLLFPHALLHDLTGRQLSKAARRDDRCKSACSANALAATAQCRVA